MQKVLRATVHLLSQGLAQLAALDFLPETKWKPVVQSFIMAFGLLFAYLDTSSAKVQ